jgi:hypothetical protein
MIIVTIKSSASSAGHDVVKMYNNLKRGAVMATTTAATGGEAAAAY